MLTARIYVDDRGYQGESLTEVEPPRPGLTSGWYSHSNALAALQFGDEPMVIEAPTNIKSHLDRIMTRVRNGTLEARRIVIEMEDSR